MIAREFRVDEILTLNSGRTWRVRDVHSNDEGRIGVGLVNPFNPNHGTSLYADVLAGLIAERPAPPPLTPTMPPCSVCGDEVECDADGFRCTHCACSWPVVGDTPGSWDTWDATQCTAVIRPFAELASDRYRAIRDQTFRCVLDADHQDELHYTHDYADQWRDDDPRAIPAEQTAEATS